jgi:arabinofuranan 3-O-arabinosyltransferase
MFFALGGPAALVVLLGCLVLRRFWSRALPAVTAAGVLAAAAVAVTGRVTGHGQDWAFGLWPQLALLIAVGAVLAAFLYPDTPPDSDVAPSDDQAPTDGSPEPAPSRS